MKYTINYNTDGKILGFVQGKEDLNIEVDNATYVEAQKFNKIIVDGKNIAFEKVDWRTPEEIQEQEQAQFRAERNQLLIEADIEINKLEDLNKDSSSWRAYRQALRDSTENWVLPTKPEGAK